MPDVVRLPVRCDCNGIDLVHPIDRMPPGAYPYLFNARVLVEGRIDARPGYTKAITLSDAPNSIRRLNDPSKSFASAGYTYIGGGGPNLYVGTESNYTPVDAGYSGDPLSLIPFRPEQSPESWMYVYDRLKSAKVRPDGVIRALGVAPPTQAPNVDYGSPANVTLTDGQVVGAWAATGGATGPTQTDRTGGSAPTVSHIIYRSGTTGWCSINPSDPNATAWMGTRMKAILNTGQPDAETVFVRDIIPGGVATTIAAIQYDSGTTGLCTIVMVGNPPGLARNSIINLKGGTEFQNVLEVNQSADGTTFSIRCSTAGTFVAGDAIQGLLTWYVFTLQTHATTETITANFLKMAQAASGSGGATLTGAINASVAANRPVDPANDYLHISIYLQNVQNVSSLQLLLSLDTAPNFSFSNPGNSYIFTIPQSQLQALGASAASWVEVVIPISQAVLSGDAAAKSLASVSGIALQLNTTGACDWGFDWWYLFGTYGPLVQFNSPVGIVYLTRFRDSSTGAHSVPSPETRYEVFPLRESVIITPQASSQDGVDEIDIYRQGGQLTSPLYVASVANNFTNPLFYQDSLPDSAVASVNQPPDLTALQPWPTQVAPWTGTALVVGTSVVWLSGSKFNTSLISRSTILINGTAYLTYGNPSSDTFLELTQDAGSIAIATFSVSAPTLTAQPLPFAFGSLEGPFAPVVFALGDPLNGGLLYFSNFSDADSASDANTLELSTPSSDLISGDVCNGMAFAGSREDIFCIRFSYLTSIGASNNTSYQWAKVSSPSGMWSRWACCSTPVGIAFLGRDGIYIATESGGVNITDGVLYPLFPHEGQAAKSVNSGSNIILPVDMTQLTFLRLDYCDETIRFSYKDTGGNFNTLIYEIYRKRWFLNNYGDNISGHYLVEGDSVGPNTPDILMMAEDSEAIMLAGGNTDNDKVINTIVLLPSMDGGDERSQKLYVDVMMQADGTGTLDVAATYDNAQSFSPVVPFTCTGSIQQFLQNIASLADLSLHRNIGSKFAWTGGPDGPRLYAWEYAGFLQPYLSTFFVTQFIPFSFPGWKHLRRMFPALISNDPIQMTVKTQDGRVFGPFTIASTAGQYRILPQMLTHGIKDLAFALQLDGQGKSFAFFPQDFVVEVKEWEEETYIKLAAFRS